MLGDGYLDNLDEEILFRSPGMRPDLPPLREAVARGATLSSEMELFLSRCPAKTFAVTGSDGKTTTTTLTSLILEEECRRRGRGRVFVGGNIGSPLLPRLGEMCAEDFAVIELSSFQLQTFSQSPLRAAVTNVSPNHLDWHLDMQEYINAKTNIFRHTGNELLITNAENAVTQNMARTRKERITFFSSKRTRYADFADLLPAGGIAYYLRNGSILRGDGINEETVMHTRDILLPGLHNLENCMTAAALTDGYASIDSLCAVFGSFTGVRHRLERIREVGGVTYYNSSIDTSPTRTAAALEAHAQLSPRKPIVICGGYDKHIPLDPLAESLGRFARAAVLTGATGPKIAEILQNSPAAKHLILRKASDFTEAVLCARTLAEPGDSVILSPACAAFDAFRNFEARGDCFCELVKSF